MCISQKEALRTSGSVQFFELYTALHFCISSKFLVFSNGSATSQSEVGDGQAAERAGRLGREEAGMVKKSFEDEITSDWEATDSTTELVVQF